MGNVLKVEKQQQIKALFELGWSYRAIEREIGVRRETISKYDHRRLKDLNSAKVPADERSKAAKCPPTSRSSAEKYSVFIKDELKLGLSAQRIYQDLKIEINATISYDT